MRGQLRSDSDPVNTTTTRGPLAVVRSDRPMAVGTRLLLVVALVTAALVALPVRAAHAATTNHVTFQVLSARDEARAPGGAVNAGDQVTVSQGQGSVVLRANIDARLPANVVRVAAAHESTSVLGDMFGPINVAKA